MLPYDQMQAMADQRIDSYRSLAEQYRVSGGHRQSGRFAAKGESLKAFLREAIESLLSPVFIGPAKPAI